MMEPLALVKKFDGQLVQDGVGCIIDAFSLPDRNWNLLIDSYNEAHKKKFPLSALECSVIIQYVKKGIDESFMFGALGFSSQRLTTMKKDAFDQEEKLSRLATKYSLSDDEYDDLNRSLRHPMRILWEDINRARSISALADFETFNEKAANNPELLMTKMKAKYKEMFSEKQETGSVNVQINVGFDVNDL